MKAITLWQPWASLLACEAKKCETRSWATSYRGPIAIHAASRKYDRRDVPGDSLHVMVQAVRPMTDKMAHTMGYVPLEMLPRGCIIATAELVGCWPIFGGDEKRVCIGSPDIAVFGNELLFGDFTPGRFAWEFANMTMLDEPIPAKGKQRIWEWDNLLATVCEDFQGTFTDAPISEWPLI